ncbi:MurR/RpiR family transcriptional regulator [Brevibacillus laterosporus]|uniref:MurR/RpiR family transcriptional regulator n=1 Tax=Brevibacillus laterosporus TaxID=1465 RepID=UPI001D331FA0|nr:MurR/RpiR family transcriptional regulator [Brevibacillus laterosporus]MBG9801533.1 transcriptional regulator [Brevibacillus laterosporus]MED2006252.1 MurR/RpiR family transcriptional regulator [Brevibacillus laterosporus]MED4766226.1 MurR/RpiR family transcriptional regulator [Brevibacillus laterosporus]
MSMSSNFREKIRKQYATLTTSQKMITKFVLEHPNLVALHTAKEIGKLTDTSETTVIRFCYALGYSGYSKFQEEIKQFLLLDIQKGPFQKYQDSTINKNYTQKFIEKTFNKQMSAIQQLSYELNEESCLKALEKIIKAEKILVVGFMEAHVPARWFSMILNTIKGNTYLYTGGTDSTNYFFTDRESEWLVIIISFPRHPKAELKFVKAVKSIGAKIISITEGEVSPIASEADVMIKVTPPEPVYVRGMTTIFSILEVLVNGFMILDAENVSEKLDNFDEFGCQFYSFIED